MEPDTTAAIDRVLRAIGYAEVVVDPKGYRSGSLNDALRLRPV
jgi:PP-loop superfamily ATP-utilizing enzyme